MTLNIFWFRRDLRLNDNGGLYHALKSGKPILPVFIFDKNILDDLDDRTDARVTFLYDTLTDLKAELEALGSTLLVAYGKPLDVWQDKTTYHLSLTTFHLLMFNKIAARRPNKSNVLWVLLTSL